jgi:hypothetical protein
MCPMLLAMLEVSGRYSLTPSLLRMTSLISTPAFLRSSRVYTLACFVDRAG